MCLKCQSVSVNDEMGAVVRSCSYTFMCLTLLSIKQRENGGGDGIHKPTAWYVSFKHVKSLRSEECSRAWLFSVKDLLIDGRKI